MERGRDSRRRRNQPPALASHVEKWNDCPALKRRQLLYLGLLVLPISGGIGLVVYILSHVSLRLTFFVALLIGIVCARFVWKRLNPRERETARRRLGIGMIGGLAGTGAYDGLRYLLVKALHFQNWPFVSEDTYASGVAWALAGAVFSATEKFERWGHIASSYNPSTGWPIPGTHLEFPYRWVGTSAKGLGGAAALGTQFKESMEIWQSPGSTTNRFIREAAAVSVNVGATAAGAALVAVTAETGPGVVAGFAGAAAIGVAGETVKLGITRLVNRYIP